MRGVQWTFSENKTLGEAGGDDSSDVDQALQRGTTAVAGSPHGSKGEERGVSTGQARRRARSMGGRDVWSAWEQGATSAIAAQRELVRWM